MESQSQIDRVDEETCLQPDLKADGSEQTLSGSEFDDDEFSYNRSGGDEEICLRPELKADGSEPVLQKTGFETDNGPGEDGVTWLLPELERDRSEPVLEMRDYTTIQTGTGFVQWHVYFPRPSEHSKSIHDPADTRLTNVFSLLSEPSTVNVFQQFLGYKEKEKLKRKEETRAFPKPTYCSAFDDDMRMKIKRYKSGINGGPRIKHELMEQEHGPNKDFKLLKDAYNSMKANVVCGPNTSFIVSDNASFKQRTPYGNTVLHLAANHGNNALVEEVAQHAPQLFTVVNDNYDTALHVAAKKGHRATIKLLLNKFLLFVRRETNGQGHQSILELMLMVSLTLFRNKQGNTFLHDAFMTSSHNGAVIFEAFEAPFIVGDSNNFDEARYKKVVHDLATFAVNVEGKSLLYLTIEANCEQGVNQLMDYCIDGDLKPKGKSPLLPALMNNNLGMLRTILSKKQGWIHLRNEQGWLPLHHSVLLGCLQGVLYLVEECPSCTVERDKNGSLPIHLACNEGHVKIVEELLKWCLDPADMVNDLGQNLLHIACTYRNYVLVRYLLEDPKLEIMINQKDINGNTPLHLATISWHPKIVHALTWDKRVDLSVLNDENLTALDIAEKSQGEMVSLSQRLTWNALVSAGTPRSSVRFHPKKVETNSTTTSDSDKHTHTTEQYKDRIDTLIVVSTLIITTSFAVGFTFPGDAEQGIPILLNRPMFHLFILSLTISVFGAISSTIILMWARLGDLHLAVFALSCAMPLLGLSLTSLSLAFLAGIYLIVCKLSWLATTFLVIGVVLILVVEFLYLLLLLPSTSSLPFFRYISYYPFLFYANIAEGKMDANKMGSKAIVRAR
ncbi:hypothetical protein K1719_038601 [Acacia pycnantha]|nr:hypothetical protein K1719_038601 [Acacia pycnantha]